MIFRRSRFAQVVDAQIDLFLRENRDVLAEVRERIDAYNRADRSEAEPSAAVAERVARARAAAAARWTRAACNAEVTGAMLRDRRWRLPRSATRVLADALDRGQLSARGHDRVLKTAWSIADLDCRDRPDAGDVTEALELRKGLLL